MKYGGGAHAAVHSENDFIEISISDEGPGIAAEKLDIAMQPFERLSRARKSDDGGYGLGLAIAKAVAEGHDGAFLLKQNTPKGLKAILRLPR